MKRNTIFFTALAAGICFAGLGGPNIVRADNIFETMNPFNWFFDDDDDDYYPYYAYGGPYGWSGHWRQYGYRGTQTVIVLPEKKTVDTRVDLPE